MHRWKILGALLLLSGIHARGFEGPDRKLLSTAPLAREIRTLPDRGLALQSANDRRGVAVQFQKVKRHIASFIVRQIEAYPAISKCELDRQLASAFGIAVNGCDESHVPDKPLVIAEAWGPSSTRRLFVVAYCIGLGFYGEGGYETVLESYVWERDRGVRRSASITPAGFSGRITTSREVCRFLQPERYWILVYGTMSGASGRVLGGAAAVFEIGPEGGKRVWNARQRIGNIRAHAHARDLRWEIEYVDAERFYAGLPAATLLDIYRVDPVKQTHRRIVHLPLD